jgi:hypothetical protein
MRYFVLLGFLDGKPGFVFHFMQGFWYRLIVDAKLEEVEQNRVQAVSKYPSADTLKVSS